MSRRALALLTAVTVLAIAAAWMVSVQRAPRTGIDRPPLFPELIDRVNEVARVEIDSARERTVLARAGEHWVVANRDAYPALRERVKRTVLGIAELRVIEGKTRRPELYPRLGVEDPDTEDASSRRVVLTDAGGRKLAALIVGKERKGSAAQIAEAALYVRKEGEAQALLVEGELAVSATPRDWMDTTLMDIDARRIRDITVVHRDGEHVRLWRPDATVADYTIEGLPPDREPRSRALLTSLGTALEELRFDDVAAAAVVPLSPGEATVTTTYRSFDGLVVKARLAENGGRTWVAFDVHHEAPAGETGGEDGRAPAEVAREAAALAERLAPWVFVLPEFKVAMMTKRLAELVRTATPAPSGASS